MTCDPMTFTLAPPLPEVASMFASYDLQSDSRKTIFFAFASFLPYKKNRPLLQISRKTTEKPTNKLKSK